MTNQRHQFRMPVARRGLVTKGQTTALCDVMDITEQGPRQSALNASWTKIQLFTANC
jgi:hypothetical protein